MQQSLANRPRLRTLPPPHSYGNQRLQGQFDRLLMMGIVMPETCWAVSVQESNKFYDWLLHLVGCFYLSDWRCTKPQNWKAIICLQYYTMCWTRRPKCLCSSPWKFILKLHALYIAYTLMSGGGTNKVEMPVRETLSWNIVCRKKICLNNDQQCFIVIQVKHYEQPSI